MNEQLKFSWGHIIAFLALIFIAYVIFMGITYYTLGNFAIAGIGSAICVILLSISILGAQIKKGTPNKYYKSIKLERCLLLISPIVLMAVFIPYNHFWEVLDQEEEIVNDFNNSIENAREIFDDYEIYSNNRINVLSHNLSNLNDKQKQNRIDELKLILLSDNYSNFKTDANLWIDNASKNSSVWNVFLLGNIDNVIAAVDNWSNDLNLVSQKHISSENYYVDDFSLDSHAKIQTVYGLENLKSRYSNLDFKFNLSSIVTMLICYIMLLFPYFLQERNAANCERFWDFWIFSSFFDTEVENDGPSFSQEVSPIKDKTETQDRDNNIINNKTGKGAPV